MRAGLALPRGEEPAGLAAAPRRPARLIVREATGISCQWVTQHRGRRHDRGIGSLRLTFLPRRPPASSLPRREPPVEARRNAGSDPRQKDRRAIVLSYGSNETSYACTQTVGCSMMAARAGPDCTSPGASCTTHPAFREGCYGQARLSPPTTRACRGEGELGAALPYRAIPF